MTKTNEHLSNLEAPETFFPERENHAFKPSIKPKKPLKRTKPNLTVFCFVCDAKLAIKYNLPRQKYSQKNNWGYWTGKLTDQKKYICNTCLVKILNGKKFAVNDWVENEEKAGHFYTYLSRGNFSQE